MRDRRLHADDPELARLDALAAPLAEVERRRLPAGEQDRDAPVADHGAVIPVMRGILTQIAAATPDWILTPRDETDLCFEGSQVTFGGACPSP